MKKDSILTVTAIAAVFTLTPSLIAGVKAAGLVETLQGRHTDHNAVGFLKGRLMVNPNDAQALACCSVLD
jgi:hypothetical protein